MADVAQILIEIAKKRGYESGEEETAVVKRGPIKMEERTIQVCFYHRGTAILRQSAEINDVCISKEEETEAGKEMKGKERRETRRKEK